MSHLHVESNTKWIFLFWGEELWKRIDRSLFASSIAQLTHLLTFEQVQKRFLELEEKIALSYMARLLAKKSFFSWELQQRLIGKGFSKESFQLACSFFQEKGVIDDQTRAGYLLERGLKRGRGPRRIQAGWKEEVEVDPQEQRKAIFRAIEKKKLQPLDWKGKKKLYCFLLQRGFDASLVEEILADFS